MCPACGIGSFAPGAWGAGSPSGTIVTATATYADVGSFAFSLEDRTFAKVDQGDSTKLQRYIGSAATTVGRFVPDHFDTAVLSNTCGAFTYSGQVFPLTITAMSGTGAPTRNYDGSYVGGLAKQVTLSDANGLPQSGFGPTNPLASSVFVSGIANLTTTPSVKYTFASKLTSPATLTVRGGDTDTVAQAPAGGAAVEGSIPLRSGSLRLSNAFGSERQNLPMTVSAMYYAPSPVGWAVNTLDGCTTTLTLAAYGSNTTTDACYGTCTGVAAGSAGSVLLRRLVGTTPALAMAAAPTPTTAVPLVAGTGTVKLTAPSTPGVLEFILVAPSWLKTNSGLGGTLGNYDWDPMGRITFGIYGPATNKRKLIYTRENY